MGLDDDEVLQQVKAISEASVDFIEISGGTYEKPLVFPFPKHLNRIAMLTRNR